MPKAYRYPTAIRTRARRVRPKPGQSVPGLNGLRRDRDAFPSRRGKPFGIRFTDEI